MSKSIVTTNVSSLIDQWMEAEQNGEQFPVDFDIAWRLAGYSTKQKAQNKLKYLKEGEDFLTDRLKTPTGGRPSKLIEMTCDAFKHFCLLSETEDGRNIRQYFIEAEKKWRLVEKVDPQFAQQIELMKLQADIAKFNASMVENQRYIMEKSEAILDLHGVQMLALIQGRPEAVVEKIEKVTETVICRDGRNVSFEGQSTAQIGKSLGFKSGAKFEEWLTEIGYGYLICQGFRALQASYVPTDDIKVVKKIWADQRKKLSRQLLIGE